METMSAFLHSSKTFNMLSLMSQSSATRRSCPRAICQGSSLRCEGGASSVVTGAPFSCRLSEYPEDSFGRGRRLSVAAVDRLGAQPQHVDPWIEHPPHGIAAGQPEGVTAREQVPEAREDAQALPFVRPQLDVEHADGLDRLAPRPGHDAT